MLAFLSVECDCLLFVVWCMLCVVCCCIMFVACCLLVGVRCAQRVEWC